ncbi:MAG: TetR/AcrR family transcriptional regulator [Traorella sp.]
MKPKREKMVSEFISEALFELMEQKEYHSITISEITNQAKVGRVSFYRNFSSKEEIIQKWLDKITYTFLEQSSINYEKDSLQEYFFKLFTHLSHYKKETTLIYQADLFHLLKEEFEKVFIESNKKYDNYKSYFIIGGIFNVYYYWVMNDFKETPKELSLKLIDILNK